MENVNCRSLVGFVTVSYWVYTSASCPEGSLLVPSRCLAASHLSFPELGAWWHSAHGGQRLCGTRLPEECAEPCVPRQKSHFLEKRAICVAL